MWSPRAWIFGGELTIWIPVILEMKAPGCSSREHGCVPSWVTRSDRNWCPSVPLVQDPNTNSNEHNSSYSLVSTNLTIYSSVTWYRWIHVVTFVSDTSLKNILRRGAGARIWHMGSYIHQLTDEYMGPQGRPVIDKWPSYSSANRWIYFLSFIFYYCLFWLPPRIGSLQTMQN
jgi:hypothetical protein